MARCGVVGAEGAEQWPDSLQSLFPFPGSVASVFRACGSWFMVYGLWSMVYGVWVGVWERFRGGLVSKAYRPLYRSTLGLRAIKKIERRFRNSKRI